MIDLQRLSIPILLFLAAIGLGFWVRAGGRPYRSLPFNFHKLAALAGVILAGIRLGLFQPGNSLEGLVFPVVAAGISAVLLFATGAALSIRQQDSRVLRSLHQAGPILIALCLGWALYLVW